VSQKKQVCEVVLADVLCYMELKLTFPKTVFSCTRNNNDDDDNDDDNGGDMKYVTLLRAIILIIGMGWTIG